MPFVTVTVTVFSPADQDAALPLATVVAPFLMTTVAFAFVGAAVILSLAFVVAAVYSSSPELNDGESTRSPIVRADRAASLSAEVTSSI